MKLIPFRADILQVEASQASFQRILLHLPTQSMKSRNSLQCLRHIKSAIKQSVFVCFFFPCWPFPPIFLDILASTRRLPRPYHVP